MSYVPWLRVLAKNGGKGAVHNIDARSLGRIADEIERLREGIQDFLDGNYEHPRSNFPHGCKHGREYYEDCALCDEAHFAKVLSSQ